MENYLIHPWIKKTSCTEQWQVNIALLNISLIPSTLYL